jgi:hypothetical protein
MRVIMPTEWLVARMHDSAALAVCLLPPIVLGLAAFRSQPVRSGYEDAMFDPVVNARISAYVEVVRDTERLERLGHFEPAALRAVAGEWIEGATAGRLKALPMQRADDTILSGAKLQISQASSFVSLQLQNLAMGEISRGEISSAAKDLMSAALVPQCIRYSDLSSVAVVSAEQRGVLRRLKDILPRTDRTTKKWIAFQMPLLKTDQKALDRALHDEARFDRLEQARLSDIARITQDPTCREKPLINPNRSLHRVVSEEECASAKVLSSVRGLL